MKRVFGRFILCVSALTTLAACSESFESQTNSGNAQVMTYMPQENGSYNFQTFELIGLTDLKAVAGRFVNFIVTPRIMKIDGVEKMDGIVPRARYIRSQSGTYVGTDNFTLELFTIYAHMQRLAAIDKELGVGDVNKWPRDIGVAVRVEGGLENNAQYYGPADAMFFVRYTKSNLPIAVNAGVLAHEHFHSLFYKLTKINETSRSSLHNLSDLVKGTDAKIETSPDPESEPAKEVGGIEFKIQEHVVSAEVQEHSNQAYMRGLNEGFADFWGWMYTGDPDFVALSLPSEKNKRTLKVESGSESIPYSMSTIVTRIDEAVGYCGRFADEKDKKMCVEEQKTGWGYLIGSRFARLLKLFTETVAQERNLDKMQSRKFVAKALLKVLPSIEENSVSPEKVITLLSQQVPGLKANECEYLKLAINALGSKQWDCAAGTSSTQLVGTP